jgi:hypothetical protein
MVFRSNAEPPSRALNNCTQFAKLGDLRYGCAPVFYAGRHHLRLDSSKHAVFGIGFDGAAVRRPHPNQASTFFDREAREVALAPVEDPITPFQEVTVGPAPTPTAYPLCKLLHGQLHVSGIVWQSKPVCSLAPASE